MGFPMTLPYIGNYFSMFRQTNCWVYMYIYINICIYIYIHTCVYISANRSTNIHECGQPKYLKLSQSIRLQSTVDWSLNGEVYGGPTSPTGLKKTNSTNISSIWGGGAFGLTKACHFLGYLFVDFRENYMENWDEHPEIISLGLPGRNPNTHADVLGIRMPSMRYRMLVGLQI